MDLRNIAKGVCAAVALALILLIAAVAWWPAQASDKFRTDQQQAEHILLNAIVPPATPPEQLRNVGICASMLTATGGALGITMAAAVPVAAALTGGGAAIATTAAATGALPALVVLVLMCAIVAGGG